MNKRWIAVLIIGLICLSCKNQDKVGDTDKYIEEIRQAEADFAARLSEIGMAAAFLEFADDNAVLSRNDKLYKGKAEIKDYLEASTLSDVVLEWTPEFIDVSVSGDMAYTYGPYTFSANDKEGNTMEATGIFHTVWKRQADGSWKFVWD